VVVVVVVVVVVRGGGGGGGEKEGWRLSEMRGHPWSPSRRRL